jgi:hypothetical protein
VPIYTSVSDCKSVGNILWCHYVKDFQLFLRILIEISSTTKAPSIQCCFQAREQIKTSCCQARSLWAESFHLTLSLRRRRLSMYWNFPHAAIPVNYTSEFQEIREATMSHSKGEIRYISSNNVKILRCNVALHLNINVLKPDYQISNFGDVKPCSLVDICLPLSMENHISHIGRRIPASQYSRLSYLKEFVLNIKNYISGNARHVPPHNYARLFLV